MNAPSYPALVLNADFTPVQIFPLSVWEFDRVLRNVMKDRVTILDSYDAVLRSPSFNYTPPSVVALKNYVKLPQRVKLTRMAIFARDDFTCQYCGEVKSPKDLTFDHVIPRAKGGESSFENLVAACMPCNSRKGHKMIKPIRMPREPNQREIARKVLSKRSDLQKTWLDYLYWSALLEK